MTEPRSVQEQFDIIAEAARTTRKMYAPSKVYKSFVDQEIAKIEKDFPHVTSGDFYRYMAAQNIKKQEGLISKPTAGQLWEAAYSYNPLGNDGVKGSAGAVTRLQTLLNYQEWEAIPLGKLWVRILGAAIACSLLFSLVFKPGSRDIYKTCLINSKLTENENTDFKKCEQGHAELALIPGKGALPAIEEDNVTKGKYSYAATDSGAIYYADGHPSEFDPPYTQPESYSKRHLRRFVSLGWVIHIRTDGSWYKTGHALVLDMENGRDHQPWIVLASHWPVNNENHEGSFMVHADKRVARNDTTQPGVLPGGRNRTPVAMIESSDKTVPVLKQFGSNFEFSVARFGGDRAYDRAGNNGPDLAYVMEWYWDPIKEQEVSFDKDGEEYMRYDRKTKEILLP